MRDVVEVCGHLYRKLPVLGQRFGEPRNQFSVIGNPLQGGVREDQVIGSPFGRIGEIGYVLLSKT